jgi:hypothetical protein
VETSEDRAIRRIQRITFSLGLAGAAVGAAALGWRWGLAFLLGAGASWVNFRWLKQLVTALSDAVESPRTRPQKRLALKIGLRYLVLAAGAYAILNYSGLPLAAALAGLLVAVAAVLLEIVFELIYAGT